MGLPTPEQIKHEREEVAELTQAELADRANVSQPLIARIENDDVDPRLSTLRKILTVIEKESQDGYVTAGDVMNTSIVSVAPDDSVTDALDRMVENGFSQLPVIRGDSTEGFLNMSDIWQCMESSGDPAKIPVEEAYSSGVVKVQEDAPIDEVKSHLSHHNAVIVMDDNTTSGIITGTDIAKYLSDMF
jgi:predicted transcriptional regulator